MKHNYYITGATGFIGRNLCRYLRNENIITDPAKLNIDLPFTVIHLSAFGNHYFQTDIQKIIQANVFDLKNLIESVSTGNLIKFYNISTSSVTLQKQTVYSASKLVGETIINDLQDERFVNVRPYSVYGPGEAEHRFIPTVIRCLKSGEQMKLDPLAVHDWIFVDDFIAAVFAGHTEIGTGLSYTNLQIVQMLELISSKKLNWTEAKLRPYDNFRWVCPKGVPHRYIYEGLKQTYESA